MYDVLVLDGGRVKTMSYLVDCDRELPVNLAKLNKAKLNISNSDKVLVKVPKQNLKRCWKPPLPHISNFSVSSIPEGRQIGLGLIIDLERSSCGGRFELSKDRLTLYNKISNCCCKIWGRRTKLTHTVLAQQP